MLMVTMMTIAFISLLMLFEHRVADQQDDLDDDRLDHQFRMQQLESSLRKKYASLDTLIASMRSSGDYLMGQLSSLPGFTRE